MAKGSRTESPRAHTSAHALSSYACTRTCCPRVLACVLTCTCMHVHVYTRASQHIYGHTRVYTRTDMHVHAYTRALTCMYTHIRALACMYTRIYAHWHACTRVYAHWHACTHVYTRTDMHVHAYTRTLACMYTRTIYAHWHTCTRAYTHTSTHIHAYRSVYMRILKSDKTIATATPLHVKQHTVCVAQQWRGVEYKLAIILRLTLHCSTTHTLMQIDR